MVSIIRRTRNFFPQTMKIKSRTFPQDHEVHKKMTAEMKSTSTSPRTSSSSISSDEQVVPGMKCEELGGSPSGSTSSLVLAGRGAVSAKGDSMLNSSEGLQMPQNRQILPSMAYTIVEKNGIRFLVCRESSGDKLIQAFMNNGITHVVQTSGNGAPISQITKAGFQVHDFRFKNGEIPSEELINKWLDLIESAFPHAGSEFDFPDDTIAIIGGDNVGIAPFLMLLAMVQAGCNAWEAIALLRAKRRGSVTQKQMAFVRAYRPEDRLKAKKEAKSGRPRVSVRFLTPRSSSDRLHASFPTNLSNRPLHKLSELKSRALRRTPRSTPGNLPRTSAVF